MHHQSHTLTFGKTLNDLENNYKIIGTLGELEICNTSDGSTSLYSNYYKESFNSNKGALKLVIEKFINPSKILRLKKNTHIITLLFLLEQYFRQGNLRRDF